MFDSLADAIQQLEVPVDERAMRTVVALRDRLDAKVTAAIGEFDQAGLWDLTGAASMTSWLIDEGASRPDASHEVRAAARLRRLHVLRDTYLAGDLTRGQVRIVLSYLTWRNLGEFANIEPTLVPTLVDLSIAETDRVMIEWRARADAETDPDGQPDEPPNSLHHSQSLGGRFVTNGAFDNDTGAVIAAAIAAADSGDLSVTPDRRRAAALAEVARSYLDHHDLNLPPRRRPHVSLVIGTDDLTRGHHEGHPGVVDAATVSRYLCDCTISRVVADKVSGAVSTVLDLGRATDVVSSGQRRALAVRDRGCRYPGCDRPVAWTDAHHIRWWTRGGRTDMDNLVLLCRRHHSLVHRRDLDAKLLPDGTFVVADPCGRVRESRPPGALPDPLLCRPRRPAAEQSPAGA